MCVCVPVGIFVTFQYLFPCHRHLAVFCNCTIRCRQHFQKNKQITVTINAAHAALPMGLHGHRGFNKSQRCARGSVTSGESHKENINTTNQVDHAAHPARFAQRLPGHQQSHHPHIEAPPPPLLGPLLVRPLPGHPYPRQGATR